MNLNIVVHYKHEISLKKHAQPNQGDGLIYCNREIVITVIVITEFDCNYTWITESNIISSFPVPSETRAKSGIGSTCRNFVNLVLCKRSRPTASGSYAKISTGTGVNMEPVVAPGTPIGTLEWKIGLKVLWKPNTFFRLDLLWIHAVVNILRKITFPIKEKVSDLICSFVK